MLNILRILKSLEDLENPEGFKEFENPENLKSSGRIRRIQLYFYFRTQGKYSRYFQISTGFSAFIGITAGIVAALWPSLSQYLNLTAPNE